MLLLVAKKMQYGRHRLLFTTPFLLSLAGQCYFLLYNKLPTSLIIAGQWNVEELEAWNDGGEETSSSYAKGVKSETGGCSRILLYASDLVAQNTGVGHRLSFYLLASVLAVLTDSALVILDPPARFNSSSEKEDQWAKLGGSPFGCPIKINGDGEYCGQLYPTGLSRIIKVPEWLSRGCDVPCIDTHSYENWIEIAERTTSKTNFTWTICTNNGDDRHGQSKHDNNELNDVAVLPIGKWHLRDYWFYRMRRKLFNGYHSNSNSNGNNRQDTPWEEWVTDFSTRMGASQSEIDNFFRKSNFTIKDDSPIDYLGALITKAKVLQFQPWVVEDVITTLEAVDLFSSDSSDSSSSLELFDTAAQSNDAVGYDAMHIRRGDRVGTNVNTIEVERYWVERGYPPIKQNITMNNIERNKGLMEAASYPTSYIPFAQYWHRYKSSGCSSNPSSLSSNNNQSQQIDIRRPVYIATDDLETVRAEIANLTNSSPEGAEYWIHCSQQIEFVFNPRGERYARHIHVSNQATAIDDQSNNTTTEILYDEGYEQYLRMVSAVTDLHILSRRLVVLC